MLKKITLSFGIILLFILSAINPLSIGFNTKTPFNNNNCKCILANQYISKKPLKYNYSLLESNTLINKICLFFPVKADITLGAVNVVLHFNVTANTDKTYIQYYRDGSSDIKNTYIDPDEINYNDRDNWLGTSITERWMIIRGLEPSSVYNYKIRIDTGDGYEDYVSGQFTTLDRFTTTSGYQDEMMDEYLWEDSSNVNLYQSVGVKRGMIDAGTCNHHIRLTSCFYDNGEYHMYSWHPDLEPDGWHLHSTNPLDFSSYQDGIVETISGTTTGIQVFWSDLIGKYVLNANLGSSDGTSFGIGNSYTHFTPINNRDGRVLTDDYIEGEGNALDGSWYFYDPLGANELIYFDNTHMPAGQKSPYSERNITDGVAFSDIRAFMNWSLGWGQFAPTGADNIRGIRDTFRILTGDSDYDTYSMGLTVRNGIYIGFINMLDDIDTNKMYVYLIYSRNGLNWSFFDYTTPIIDVGPSGSWDDGMILCWSNVILRNNTNTTHDWLYYTGFDNVHYSGQPPLNNANLGRIDFRINGLTYAQPTSNTGWIRTTTINNSFVNDFTVNGNFSVTNSLTIEVINASSGKVYQNFGADDFNVITTDETAIIPTWKGRNLTHIPLGDFKLNFSFNGSSGKLYAYNLENGKRNIYVGEPQLFTAIAYNKTKIDLSWLKGENADYTHIRYIEGEIPPGDITSGILLYNNSGIITSATGLKPNTKYSFSGWSWNQTKGTWSPLNATVNATTKKNIKINYLKNCDGYTGNKNNRADSQKKIINVITGINILNIKTYTLLLNKTFITRYFII